MATTQAIRPTFARGIVSAATTTSVPQSESLAGAVLAVLPAVYGVSLLLPAAGAEWNPIHYALIGLGFYLASVTLAAVDEAHLRRSGVEAATAYWALLSTMPYLVARTRALVAADRAGLGMLWIAIASSLATLAGLLLVASV
jgi:hypothetical protein